MNEIIMHAIAFYIHGFMILLLMLNGRIYHRYRKWTWSNFMKSIKYSLLSYVGVGLLGMGVFDPFKEIDTCMHEGITIK